MGTNAAGSTPRPPRRFMGLPLARYGALSDPKGLTEQVDPIAAKPPRPVGPRALYRDGRHRVNLNPGRPGAGPPAPLYGMPLARDRRSGPQRGREKGDPP